MRIPRLIFAAAILATFFAGLIGCSVEHDQRWPVYITGPTVTDTVRDTITDTIYFKRGDCRTRH